MMRAALGLGLLVFTFGFVGSSYAQSVDELIKAADAGNAVAESKLADKFQSGDGVQKDLKKAFCWAHRSADHGFPNAWLTVGMSYGMGTGVTKDNIESYKWFYILNSIPETAKDPEISKWGKEDAAGISRQMTPEQISEAKRRADLWWKTVVSRGHPTANQMYVPYAGDRPAC